MSLTVFTAVKRIMRIKNSFVSIEHNTKLATGEVTVPPA